MYDKLSVERLDYPECKSTVFRPSNFDEIKYDRSLPDTDLELEFIYGYAGFSPTVGTFILISIYNKFFFYSS